MLESCMGWNKSEGERRTVKPNILYPGLWRRKLLTSGDPIARFMRESTDGCVRESYVVWKFLMGNSWSGLKFEGGAI